MKKLYFKYTVKLDKKKGPETHYVKAYTEDTARTALATHLGVEENTLWAAQNNLPFKVRQEIQKGTEGYKLTLDVDTLPAVQSSVEERKAQSFDLKSSMLKTLKYQVLALSRIDPELFETFPLEGCPPKSETLFIYHKLREAILDHGFADEKFDNGIHILDILDSIHYSVAVTPENYQLMKEVCKE